MSQRLPEKAEDVLRMPLTIQQRVELIGELWDGIPDSVDSLLVPEWHREELERRLVAADADAEGSVAWEEVKKELSDQT